MTRKLILHNSAWLIADKIIRLGLGLVVWLLLARQVGPELFGTWSFAMSLAALFGVVATLGIDGIVQRELSSSNAPTLSLLGTAAVLKVLAGSAMVAACILAASLIRPGEPLVLELVALNAMAFWWQAPRVAEFLFQARMRNSTAVLAAAIAFLVGTLLRAALLYWEASLVYFGLTLVIEAGMAALLLVFRAGSLDAPCRLWTFDRALGWRLLAQGWPMLLSGLAVMAYMRLDQVMIASIAGDKALGHFSAALKLAEAWYFIPQAITVAVFPVMIREFERNAVAFEAIVQKLYDVMLWLGLTIAIIVSLLAERIIEVLYGSAYAEAAPILSIQIWSGIIASMSYVHGRWLLTQGLQAYSLIYTLSGALLNVSLNLYLIPNYGAKGAAWATLVAQFGPTLMQFFIPKARGNLRLMVRALNAPLRLFNMPGKNGHL